MMTPAIAPQAPRRRRLVRAETVAGYLFIAPWIVGFVVMTLGPFVASFALSFTKWELLGAAEWVGLRNYEQMFVHDPRFWLSLQSSYEIDLAVGQVGAEIKKLPTKAAAAA